MAATLTIGVAEPSIAGQSKGWGMFELAINMKTAKAMGITFPRTILVII